MGSPRRLEALWHPYSILSECRGLQPFKVLDSYGNRCRNWGMGPGRQDANLCRACTSLGRTYSMGNVFSMECISFLQRMSFRWSLRWDDYTIPRGVHVNAVQLRFRGKTWQAWRWKNLEEPSKWFVCVNPGYIILRQDNPTMCLSVLLIFCVIIRITPLCYVFVLWTLQSSEFRSSFVLKASHFCLLRSYRFRHLLRQYAGLLFNSSREARGCAPFSQLGWVVQWSMAFELIQQMEPDDESLEKEMSWKSSFSFSIG